MPFQRLNDDSKKIGILGVAAKCFLPHRNKHVGFVYRDSDDQISLSHLAFHHIHRPRQKDIDEDYFVAASGLEPISQTIIAGMLDSLVQQALPYGINEDGCVFRADNTLIPPPPGRGLTCATYVTALMEVFGFPIIQRETWPTQREGDAAFHAQIVQIMREHHVDPDHVTAVAEDVGAVSRVRPEEAAAAMTLSEDDLPAAFGVIEPLGKRLVTMMDEAGATDCQTPVSGGM